MSTVFRGKWRFANVAIKAIRGAAREAALVDFKKECELLLQLRHDRIALFMAVCTDIPRYVGAAALIMKYFSKGLLYHILHELEALRGKPLEDKMKIAFKLADGMRFLHASSRLEVIKYSD
jgi:hypothetical protein